MSSRCILTTATAPLLRAARFVLMHCWQANRSCGGVSWISHVDHIIELASPDLIERLCESTHTTPYGSASILQRNSHNRWQVRFNRRAMQCKVSVALRLGDCIVVHNYRVLHGRSGSDPKSGD